MAYDEDLAERVRQDVTAEPGISERKMFGGMAFMAGGNMFAGLMGDELMLRLGAEGSEAALSRPHVRDTDPKGRRMGGMVFVEPPGVAGAQLHAWVREALAHARSLPPKS